MQLNYLNQKLFRAFPRRQLQACFLSILSDTVKPKTFFKSDKRREDQYPLQADVLIIGGGLIGMSVAFWLRWTAQIGVTVIERDPTYAHSASLLGRASIRQQFSEPESVQMSLFSSEFLRNASQYLRVLDDVDVDIGFNPQGCLLLADTSRAEKLYDNYLIQKELGAKVELLSQNTLQKRWPWLNVSDVELGCYGFENEGWFDPRLLLIALHKKCNTLGVNYIPGELVDLNTFHMDIELSQMDLPERAPIKTRFLRNAIVTVPDKDHIDITFATLVNAAGPWAANVARMAEIGSDHLNVPLPVEPRFQRVYVIRPGPLSQSTINSSSIPRPEPSIDTPFIIDHTRMCVERMGLSGDFVVYSTDDQTKLSEPADKPDELCVDRSIFNETLAPKLRNRIPSMASPEIRSAWTSVCDYNTVDQSLIIGSHSFHRNFYLCNGSSGYGAQHAIAIGRAVSELILYGHYRTIDLTRFSFDRFYLNKTVNESLAF